MDDQRHVDLALVQRVTMSEDMVLAELLPVVGGDDDDGVRERAAALELAEEIREATVDIFHLAVVEISDTIELGLGEGPDALASCRVGDRVAEAGAGTEDVVAQAEDLLARGETRVRSVGPVRL